MKKMIITAAIVLAAALTHAGTVKWGSVALYNDNDAKVKTSATFYVYQIASETAFNSLGDVWAEYGSDVMAGGLSAFNAGGTKTGSLTSKASVDMTSEATTTYYAALIATIDTADGLKYYTEKASVLTGDDGNGSYTLFGTGHIDSAAVAKSTWQSAAVPEPTSGLLLLVGGALLALRRKQK